jgi:hypothetical protein
MPSRLRTLLLAPWQRFRLSLSSFLLGSTLVAVIVAHRFAAREVDRLRLQVAALRTENKGYRDRLSILTVTDPARTHAIYSPQLRGMPHTWQWQYYTPPGRQFRLCLAYDDIAPSGVFPAADPRIVVLADNLPVEGSVTCSIQKGTLNDPNGGRVIMQLSHITTNKTIELPQDSSVWVRPTIQYQKEIGGDKTTIDTTAGQPLVLLRLRGHHIFEVERNGTKAHPRLPPDDSPGPGVLLWIEEQPASLAAAK